MQRLRHFLNQKTFKIRNVYIATAVFTIVVSTIVLTVENHFATQAIKQEQAEAERLLNERLAKAEQERKLKPLLNNPLPPKDTNSVNSTGKYDPNKPPGNAPVNPSDPLTEPRLNIFTYRYPSGLYQGMTYPQAYTAWKAKKDEITNRLLNTTKRAEELATIQVDSANAELSLMLSMFKNMTPENLEKVKTATLKAYPKESEKIESFFNDVANHTTTKSAEEVAKDADFILKSRQANRIARKQNHAKFDNIYSELERINSEEPIKPDVPDF